MRSLLPVASCLCKTRREQAHFEQLWQQIPCISSPFIVYKFAAGLAAFLSFGSPEGENTGLYIGWELRLGSFWSFYHQQGKPLRVGVNLAALAILVSLWAAVQPANSITPQKRE